MHAILVTMGTDGNVFPYVGLGARLRGRGHRVTLAGPETYQGLAAPHGLGFQCVVSQAVGRAGTRGGRAGTVRGKKSRK